MKIVAQLSALDIKVFKWVDRKQLNVLNEILEYLKFYILAY